MSLYRSGGQVAYDTGVPRSVARLSRLVGRRVALVRCGRTRYGRLSVASAGGETFYEAAGARFCHESVESVRTSGSAPTIVLR